MGDRLEIWGDMLEIWGDMLEILGRLHATVRGREHGRVQRVLRAPREYEGGCEMPREYGGIRVSSSAGWSARVRVQLLRAPCTTKRGSILVPLKRSVTRRKARSPA